MSCTCTGECGCPASPPTARQLTDARLDECAQQAGLWLISAPIDPVWRARLRDFIKRATAL